MQLTKEYIQGLVADYIIAKHKNKTWNPGKDWVQYAGPYFDCNEYVNAVGTLLDEWLVLGNDAIKFEKEFPKWLAKDCGIVTNSGSSSNLLMLAAVMVEHPLKKVLNVICPVAGFPTTVNPILQLGHVPKFVDIELDTLNIDVNKIEEQLPADVLTFAHVLGNPPDMNAIMKIVNSNDLILLEDCCDALGSTFNGDPLGKFGDYASCSFYPAHHITMGEGGFVACNGWDREKILRSLREWGRGCFCVGQKANLSPKGTCGCRFKNWLSEFPDEIFDHKYVYETIGYNLKPIELQCSMGLAQLEKLPEIIAKRKANHTRLTEIFKPYKEFFHFHKATAKADPAWFAFPITVRDGAPFKRSQFTRYMEGQKIQTRNYFGGNLLLQPAYRYLDETHDAKTRYPVATKVTTDTLFLGTSPVITKEQLDYIQEKVDDFFTKKLWQSSV